MDGVLYIMQSGDKYVYKYNFTRNNYYCIWTIVIVIMYLTDTTHLIILDTPIHVYMYMYMYMTTCTVHVITIILVICVMVMAVLRQIHFGHLY